MTQRALIDTRTLPLFGDDDPPSAPREVPRPRVLVAPAPPPASPPTTLAPRRHLTLLPSPVVDLWRATRGWCLGQADECDETDCRYHLGAARALHGQVWRCALNASDELGELTPHEVGVMLGTTESEVQSILSTALPRIQRAGAEDALYAARELLDGDLPDDPGEDTTQMTLDLS